MHGQHLAGDVGGQAEREQVDRHAGDDLVDPVGDHQHAERQPHQPADDDRRDQPDPPAGERADDGAGEGAGEQHALDADIDHRDPLPQRADQPAERDRHGAHHGRLQHAGEGELLARRRPHQERRHRQEEADAEEQAGAPGGAAHELAGAEKGEHRRHHVAVGRRRHDQVGQREQVARQRQPEGRLAGGFGAEDRRHEHRQRQQQPADDQRLAPPDDVEVGATGRRVGHRHGPTSPPSCACGTPTGRPRASAAAPRRRR